MWDKALNAATALERADTWRQQLARHVRIAAGAKLCAVLTCPPGKVLEAQAGVDPAESASAIERMVFRFLPRIERGGEGWEAMRQLGTHPYAPLERARTEQDRALAALVRTEILQPEGIDGLVNAFLLDGEGALYGWIVVADAAPAETLLDRCAPLGGVARAAASTLAGALKLAEACGGGPPKPHDPALDRLTDREGQVLRLIAAGLKDGQIAERLGISEQTVGSHLRRIYEKLGVHSRSAAAARLR